MKLKSLLTASIFAISLAGSANATVVAAWDFTSGSPLVDTSSNGNTGTNGGGVTFNASGANMVGANNSEITVPYSAGLEPGAIGAGETWQLTLTGIQFNSLGAHQAVYNSRDTNGFGTILYKDNAQKLSFWIGNAGGGWNQATVGPAVTTLGTYNVVATWDGTAMEIDVTGDVTANASTIPGSTGFNTGTRPISFGNGGNNQSEFLFNGQLAAAQIEIIPEPGSFALLGLAGAGFLLRRKRR